MGACCSSQVRNQVAGYPSFSLAYETERSRDGANFGKISSLFDFVTSGVFKADFPPFNVASLCMSESSIPIVFAKYTNKTNMNEIKYPLISMNMSGNSCMCIFSSMSVLEMKCLHKFDTTKLVLNIFHYLQGNSNCTRILVISDISDRIVRSLDGLGLSAERGTLSNHFSMYGIIVITSEQEINEEHYARFRHFTNNGGGIAVFYNNTYDNINKFIKRAGLAFTNVEHLCETKDYVFEIPARFSEVKSFNFCSIRNQLISYLNDETTDANTFDDAAYKFRLHIAEVKDSELFFDTYKRLLKYNKSEASNFFANSSNRNIISSICMMLTQILAEKLPHDMLEMMTECVDCPLIETKTIKLKIKPNEWNYTGLFLPPDVEATYETESADVVVQIGSHTEIFVTTREKWGRYPIVTKRSNDGKLFNQFGGLIYIIGPSDEECEITFHNVASDEYSEWRFVELETFSFVLSKKSFEKISDKKKMSDQFKKIGEAMTSILHDNYEKKPLVVFDTNDGDTLSDSYPLTVNMKHEENILNPFAPSNDLIVLISRIARLRIPELAFDIETETAICIATAHIVMKQLFPGFESSTNNLIAEGLIKFVNYFPVSVLRKSIASIIKAKVPVKGAAIMLIKELSGECGKNVSPLFMNTIEIPPMVYDFITKLPSIEEKESPRKKIIQL